MKYLIYLSTCVFLLLVPSIQAARPTYQSGVVTRVEKKTHERTLYYLVNTPVMTEDPYYEISVRVNNVVYVGEYAVREKDDELPFDWKTGDEVRVSIDKPHMYIQRPGGGSLKMVIEKHISVPDSNGVNSH
jgi:hypothetical protein